MKKKFTLLLSALALMACLAPTAWGGVKLSDNQRVTQKQHETTLGGPEEGLTRADVVAYTLTPANGSNNTYANNCDITINGITWNLTGNSQMNPWRIGGKSLNGVNRALYSKTAISDNITKIEVTHGDANITVNSWTVIVASDADFNNVVSTLTPTFTAQSTTTINRPAGADWSNCYYKFVYNVTASGSSNKYLEFTKAEFYKDDGDTPTPVINASNPETLAYDATSGSIAYTITNPVEGQNLTATSTAGWISDITVGDEAVTFTTTANEGTIDREATITLSYEGATDKVITVTQGHFQVDYATLPFNYYGGVLSDFSNLNGTSYNLNDASSYAESHAPYRIKFTNTGDYLQVKCNQQPGKVTIGVKMIGGNTTSYITVQGSADGETFTNVETLTISGAQNDVLVLETTNAFATNVRYVRLYFTKGSNVGVGPISIALPSTDPYITAENVEIEYDATSGSIAYSINNEPTPAGTLTAATESDWLTIGEISGNAVAFTCSANTAYTSRPATVVLTYTYGDNQTSTATVTVTQGEAPFQPVTYTLATTIESGRHYIVVGFNGDDAYAMGTQNNNNRAAVEVTLENGVATVSSADVFEFVINVIDDGVYTIYDERNQGYLYAASSSANQLKNETHLDDNDNALWTITLDADNNATITAQGTAQGGNSHNIMRYNKSSHLFSCYASNNASDQENIYLYVRDDETEYTFYKDIKGYGSSNNAGYYLIASPVSEAIMPNPNNGFLTGNYDLYYFDYNEELEWRNYEATPFAIESCKGYLYASNAATTLVFTGTKNEIDPEFVEFEVELSQGWNLIGNPYSDGVLDLVDEDDDFVPYLQMNEDGDELEPANIVDADGDVIAPMEGVFVWSDEGGESVYFEGNSIVGGSNNSNNSNVQSLSINVSKNRGNRIDRAMVRFNGGGMLPKLQLNPNHTKVYFTEGSKDYAIVRSANEGEIPVNFKAESNGTYTIAVEPHNVEMNYLHLVDNKTGADVDLLATPSYSFEARTTDYASRFRLVFNANNTEENITESNAFAFFNGSTWTVSNTGEATLQVVDVMGRVVSTETLNGNAEVNLNQAAGVYMLRLVNGENVKVQKVVVK